MSASSCASGVCVELPVKVLELRNMGSRGNPMADAMDSAVPCPRWSAIFVKESEADALNTDHLSLPCKYIERIFIKLHIM
eukprot:750600-Hanusia_phi.AAC.2